MEKNPVPAEDDEGKHENGIAYLPPFLTGETYSQSIVAPKRKIFSPFLSQKILTFLCRRGFGELFQDKKKAIPGRQRIPSFQVETSNGKFSASNFFPSLLSVLFHLSP
jgi:hypothetical protein